MRTPFGTWRPSSSRSAEQLRQRRFRGVEHVDLGVLETKHGARRKPDTGRQLERPLAQLHPRAQAGRQPPAVDLGLRARQPRDVGGPGDHGGGLGSEAHEAGDRALHRRERFSPAPELVQRAREGEAAFGVGIELEGPPQVAARRKRLPLTRERTADRLVEQRTVPLVGVPRLLELVLDHFALAARRHVLGRHELRREPERTARLLQRDRRVRCGAGLLCEALGFRGRRPRRGGSLGGAQGNGRGQGKQQAGPPMACATPATPPAAATPRASRREPRASCRAAAAARGRRAPRASSRAGRSAPAGRGSPPGSW